MQWGGESTGAVLFSLESVSSNRYGLMGGIVWGTVGVGMLFGSFASTLVAHSHSEWMWRVPFLLGLLTGFIGYFVRRHTIESSLFETAFKQGEVKKFPLGYGFLHFKKEILIITAMYALSAMISYLIFVFMPTYAANVAGMPFKETSFIGTCVYAGVTFFVPFVGFLSDRFSRKKCLMWSSFGFFILSYPLFKLIAMGSLPGFIFAEILFLIMAGFYQGVLNTAVFELFPTTIRYSVIATGYNISYSIFGGMAPFIATYLVSMTHNPASPGWFLMGGAFVAFMAILFIKQRVSYAAPQLKTSYGYESTP